MWRFIFNPDSGMAVAGMVITLGSMALSGLCGWQLAEGYSPIIQAASAGMLSSIAFLLSLNTVRRQRYLAAMRIAERERDKVGYIEARDSARGCLFALILLVAANIATDYMASAALRDNTSTRANNINSVAINARSEVKRIEKRQSEIRQQTAWQTTYLAPSAYDSLIAAANLVRDNEAKRGGCGRICEQKTKELAELEAAKANALQRQALKREMETLDVELKNAKKFAAENGKVSNAAKAVVTKIVAMWTQKLDGDDTELQWGENYFLAFLTIVITGAIYFTSADMGRRLGPLAPAQPFEYQPAPRRRNNWLEAPDDYEAPPQPIPLKAEPASPPPATGTTSSNITVYSTSSKTGHDRDAIARLQREIADALGKDFDELTGRLH